ncbi:MAG: hypothetical protein Q8O56_04380, partial [Solirubrobacteraceae bacterium]|nr:hypothetical protein [Solirubrobacteraceae bacterium]
MTACDACLRRTALVAQLAPHIERTRRERHRLRELLALADDELIAALAGEHRPAIERAHGAFDAQRARERLSIASLQAVCCHDGAYPPRLLDGADAPAVLHVAGDVALLAALADR